MCSSEKPCAVHFMLAFSEAIVREIVTHEISGIQVPAILIHCGVLAEVVIRPEPQNTDPATWAIECYAQQRDHDRIAPPWTSAQLWGSVNVAAKAARDMIKIQAALDEERWTWTHDEFASDLEAAASSQTENHKNNYRSLFGISPGEA